MITNIYNEADKRLVIDEDRFMFTQRFTEDGTPTGQYEADVDGSVTPVSFSIKPPAGVRMIIEQVIVYIEDTGKFESHRFGHDVLMHNGIEINRRHEGAIIATIPIKIKTNADVASLMYDVNTQAWSANLQFLVAKWDVGRAQQGITIDGNHNDSVEMVINDDLTAISRFWVTAQGVANIMG